MIQTLKRKIANIALAGIVVFICVGVATTTALISTAADTSVAHADEWKKSENRWWYQTGKSYATGWKQIGGTWYYFDNNGWMKTGWQKIGGTWYYFKSDGAMVTGWNKVGGAWYFHEPSGAMCTHFRYIGSKCYYFGTSGAMVTGWQYIGTKWRYFYNSGEEAHGAWVGNYYLKNDGTMATNQWIGKYHVNASGLWDRTNSSIPADDRFIGMHNGSLISSYNTDMCSVPSKVNLAMNITAYDRTTDTYTIEISCILHYHRNFSGPYTFTGDDFITIPSFEAPQGTLTNGGVLWTGKVNDSLKSRLLNVTISCSNYDPSKGTITVRVDYGKRQEYDTYSVRLR